MADAEKASVQNRAISEAKGLFDRGDYDGALKGFASLVNQDPENAEHIAWLARAYSGKGDTTKSMELANKALAIDEKQPMAYFVRGMAYFEQGNQPQALVDFNTSITLNPNFSRVYVWRGDLFSGQEKFREAIKNYSKALELEPESKWIHSMKAGCFLRLEDNENAIIEMALYHETSKPKQYSITKETPRESAELFTEINKHLTDTLAPLLKQTGEHFIESWISSSLSGGREESRIRDGNSMRFIYGTRGLGYLCLTDRAVYIVSFGRFSHLLKKGLGGFLIEALTQTIDSTSVEKNDTIIKIPYSTINSARLKTQGGSKTAQIEIGSTETNATIETYIDQALILTAINMGMQGRLAEIWNPLANIATPKSPEAILALIEKLSALKERGAISEKDFETKKSELLSRL